VTHQDDSSQPSFTDGIEQWEEEHVDREFDVVYLPDEGVLGVVLHRGAHFSTVYFIRDGHTFEVNYDNEELEPM
jgi:hypothetical protein